MPSCCRNLFQVSHTAAACAPSLVPPCAPVQTLLCVAAYPVMQIIPGSFDLQLPVQQPFQALLHHAARPPQLSRAGWEDTSSSSLLTRVTPAIG